MTLSVQTFFAMTTAIVFGVGVAGAQSVEVRNATPGSTIELSVNAASAGTATADARGGATIPVPPLSGPRAQPIGRLFVDRCADRLRIVLAEPTGVTLPAGVCTRRDVPGLYVIRSVTTLVVDASGDTPAVRVSEGTPPEEWFRQLAPGEAVASLVWAPERGLVLSGTAGMLSFGDTLDFECGDVSTCGGQTTRNAYSGGATFWLSRLIGVSGTFTRPGSVVLEGDGGSFDFNTTVETERLVTATALAGAPIGRVRIYGLAGLNHHRATTSTRQTIDPTTIVVDGVEQTVPGGSQTFVRTTTGWGWSGGGGAEVWLTRRFAIYGEAGLHTLRGREIDEGEAQVDSRVRFVHLGGRILAW
jgi:hypothetical protein